MLDGQRIGQLGRLDGDPQLRGHLGRIPFAARRGASPPLRYLRPRSVVRRRVDVATWAPTLAIVPGSAAPWAAVACDGVILFVPVRAVLPSVGVVATAPGLPLSITTPGTAARGGAIAAHLASVAASPASVAATALPPAVATLGASGVRDGWRPRETAWRSRDGAWRTGWRRR